MKPKIKWNKIEDGNPADIMNHTAGGSDEYYLVMLHGRFMAISYFFVDSFGAFWSSRWDVWDKAYSDGEVTHWAECPELPR